MKLLCFKVWARVLYQPKQRFFMKGFPQEYLIYYKDKQSNEKKESAEPDYDRPLHRRQFVL